MADDHGGRSLERRTRLLQEHNFLGRAGAAEHGVAVRIAPETVDDGLVLQLEVEVFRDADAGEQLHCGFVDGGRFAVHVRHVQEHALLRAQRRVGADAHRFLRQNQRHAVLREGFGAVAEQVARELVEHDDFGQAAVRGVAPGTQFTQAGLRVQCAEALLQQAVEIGVFLEPQGAVDFGEPEVGDGAGSECHFSSVGQSGMICDSSVYMGLLNGE